VGEHVAKVFCFFFSKKQPFAPMKKVAILISGRGSNMLSLLQATAEPGYPAEIAVVIANRADAGGIKQAQAHGIDTLVIPHKPHGPDRAAHEAEIDAALRACGVELVCLAGYMRILTPFLVGRWAGRMLNIHPSLLPAFPGLHTHERAIAAGAKLAGCTVHWVTEGMDEGPALVQAAVPVLPGDTPDTLAARVLAQEHVIYPLALRLAALGETGSGDAASALVNPLPAAPPQP